MNCTANQLTLGVLGPVSYNLGLTDSLMYVQPSVRVSSCNMNANIQLIPPKTLSLRHNLRIRMHWLHIHIWAALRFAHLERSQVHNGLVAIKTLRYTQPMYRDWLRTHRLLGGRPALVCGERRRHVCHRWYRHRCAHNLGRGYFWHKVVLQV